MLCLVLAFVWGTNFHLSFAGGACAAEEDLTTEQEICCICQDSLASDIFPLCKNKPTMHRVHTTCFLEAPLTSPITKCPLCNGPIVNLPEPIDGHVGGELEQAGLSPLRTAVIASDVEAVTAILQTGEASVHECYTGIPLLFDAIACYAKAESEDLRASALAICAMLVDHGALTASFYTQQKFTALHYASMQGALMVCCLLMGTDALLPHEKEWLLRVRTKAGLTASALAAKYGHGDIADSLYYNSVGAY